MSESESRSAIVLELAEEFLDRYRKGERPALKEYIDRHPELAAEIKEVFPAMAMMENIAVADSSLEGDEPKQPESAEVAFKQLGDYRIIREIGHGGMGVVYEAEQVSLGRHVALKVLPHQALADAKHKRRFEREAKAAAKLHHTNIVPVFGVGEHEGLPYYVMQFIQGLGLDTVLDELNRMQPGAAHTPTAMPTADAIRVSRRDVSAVDMARSLMTGAFQNSDADVEDEDAQPQRAIDATADQPADSAAKRNPVPSNRTSGSSGSFSDSFTVTSSSITLPGTSGSGQRTTAKKLTYWQSVANIGRQVADALEYAHKQGILHRDIKPSNLLLDLRGIVWVTDFGLAKVAEPGADNITHSGDILGTLRYMPPEAFEGKSDARSDVYSLGLTMYELLAMRPAFDERVRHKLIKQVTTGEPVALDQVNRAMPRDLATIIHKSIDREPSRRYATAEDMAADLQRFLDDEPIRARRQTQVERLVRWARRNPGLAVMGSVLAAVLVLVTAVSLLAASYFNRLSHNEAQAAQNERDARRAESVERERAELEKQRADDEARLARKAEQEAGNRAAAEAAANTLAQQETKRAEAERKRAEEQLTRAEWLVYAGKLMLAQNDFEAGNGGFALHYLDECQCNLRGWEHRYLWTRFNAKQTLQGNTGEVWCVAFSPDGKRIVIGGQRAAMVWDAERGQELFTLVGHTSPVRGAVFSPDGKRVVTGAGDPGKPAEAKVWDAATGRELLTLTGMPGEVWSVAYSPDGKRIVTGAGDRRGGPGEAKVWDAATGQELFTLKGHQGAVHGVAYSPDGKRIVTGTDLVRPNQSGEAKVWDAATGQELFTLKGHQGAVHGVAYSPDGKRIVTGAGDPGRGEVRVWDAVTGRELLALKGHAGMVNSVAFSPDGKRIVTGSADNTVKLWDVATGQEVHALKGHEKEVTSVAVSADGTRIVTGSIDRTAKVWDAERGQKVLTLPGQGGVRSVAVSSDGKRIVTGSDDQTARVWDAATGQELLALKGIVHSVAISPDGTRIATGQGVPNNHDRVPAVAKVWDAGTGRELLALKGHTSWVRSIAFSSDGKRIVTGSDDQTAKVWDAATGKELLALEGHTRMVWSVAFSPGGKRIATGSWDGTAKVWDAATGQELFSLNGHPATVFSVAFSPDGKRIVTGSQDGTAIMWDAEKGEKILTLHGHKSWVNGVAFSPDGKRIATASQDHTVKVWDAETSLELLALKGHTNVVFTVAFSPDGKRLVTGSWDRTAKVWDAATSQSVLVLQGHADMVTRVAFSPDGKSIFAWDTQNKVLAWSAADGKPTDAINPPPAPPPGPARSPDGFRHAVAEGKSIAVTDRRPPSKENVWPLPAAAERIAYHTEQAALAVQHKQWFAAEFHLGRVLRDDPDNAAAKSRVAQIPYLIALDQKKFAAAARLWAEALASDPKLGDDRQTQSRYSAARAAAMAAAGQGQGEPPLDDAAKAQLRRQALDWLKAELSALDKLPESAWPKARPADWRKDSDLASIRDAAALAKLPPAEQKRWQALWAEVEAFSSFGEHFNRGLALSRQGKIGEAITEYRTAIRRWPDFAEAYCNLGLSLQRQGGHAEALKMLRRGHELGSQRPGWKYPSAQWVAQAERVQALVQRFSAVFEGKDKPADNAERLAFAKLAYDRAEFAFAARLWAEALTSDPQLSGNRQMQHPYNAACAAALAAAGQSKGEPPLDDAAKAKLRRQALDWLKAELNVWDKLLTSGPPEVRPFLVQTLSHWQKDSDLAGIRDMAALAQLPADEQKAFSQLWADAAALLKKAAEMPK